MALNHNPVCRICRREGRKLFLKGDRCSGPKCTFEKKGYGPGQHGRSRRGKVSEYGVQLREKQKIRESYGLLERQFHRFFREAQRQKGVTGENLMAMLESRLDNVVYRIGFASSRRQARQLVRHRHFMVNGRIVDIPSYVLQPSDHVRVRERSKKLNVIHDAMQKSRDGKLMPNLQLDKAKMEGIYSARPNRNEIPLDVNEQLVVELYSR
ncbi:30S ribosomal protein S4 [candidate division KSB1 bacterium]|nr:30S ribosomal protein S4 [candidate division KSB1 bacterium]